MFASRALASWPDSSEDDVGTLEDISLLSDLLALPRWPDEHPKERRALVWAMRRIARG